MPKTYKYMNKDILSKINHISDTIFHYNRTIRQEAVDALPDDTLFPIVFDMLHEHRAGEPFEPHVRVMLAVPKPGEERGLSDRMMLDMHMDLYSALPEVEVPDEAPKAESAT